MRHNSFFTSMKVKDFTATYSDQEKLSKAGRSCKMLHVPLSLTHFILFQVVEGIPQWYLSAADDLGK